MDRTVAQNEKQKYGYATIEVKNESEVENESVFENNYGFGGWVKCCCLCNFNGESCKYKSFFIDE